MPFYPSKVLRIRERAPTSYSFVVFNLGFTFESLKALGACQLGCVIIVGGLEETLREFWKQIAPPTLAFVVINDFEEEEQVESRITKKEK